MFAHIVFECCAMNTQKKKRLKIEWKKSCTELMYRSRNKIYRFDVMLYGYDFSPLICDRKLASLYKSLL